MPNRTCFVPESWELTDALREWTTEYRTIDGLQIDPTTIDRLVDEFRDVEFPKPRKCFDRCWRRFIRNQIEWGKAKMIAPRRKPQEITEDERQQDILKFREQMQQYGVEIDE